MEEVLEVVVLEAVAMAMATEEAAKATVVVAEPAARPQEVPAVAKAEVV